MHLEILLKLKILEFWGHKEGKLILGNPHVFKKKLVLFIVILKETYLIFLGFQINFGAYSGFLFLCKKREKHKERERDVSTLVESESVLNSGMVLW